MTLSKPTKLLLLAATLWLPVYMVLFMTMIFSRILVDFDLLWRIHIGTMLLQVVTIGFYVVHLFRTDSVPRDKKALWGITLFSAAPIAMPIYWLHHVWREDRVNS